MSGSAGPKPSAEPTPWFSVTMTLRNNRASIEACLGSVLPQLDPGGELVIVDSISEDGTREFLDALARRDRRVRVLEERCNRGVGRNRAVEVAQGSIVLTQVDGDVRYEPGVLRQVAGYVRDHPGVGGAWAVGATDWDPSTTRFYAWRRDAFRAAGGYPRSQEREDPPLLLGAFRSGIEIHRLLLPKVAEDLKPRPAGFAGTVGPWGRARHTMWAARRFRLLGYHLPEYWRLLWLTRRGSARFLAGVLIGSAGYLVGAVRRDGPEVISRDLAPDRTSAEAVRAAHLSGPGNATEADRRP